MAFSDSIHVDAQSGPWRNHFRVDTDNYRSMPFGAETRSLPFSIEEEFVHRKQRLQPPYSNDWTKPRFPDDYTVPQWTVAAPTASSASTVADHEDHYVLYPLPAPLKAAEPVIGKEYHAQLFERGQKLIERFATEEQSRMSRPESTLRADAPPFVSTGSDTRPPPSGVPLPALSRNSQAIPPELLLCAARASANANASASASASARASAIASANAPASAPAGMELKVDLDFLKDDEDDDEEILFNANTIL